jgi:hypothetical protein
MWDFKEILYNVSHKGVRFCFLTSLPVFNVELGIYNILQGALPIHGHICARTILAIPPYFKSHLQLPSPLQWADKYGPVYTLRLGMPTVVVTDANLSVHLLRFLPKPKFLTALDPVRGACLPLPSRLLYCAF